MSTNNHEQTNLFAKSVHNDDNSNYENSKYYSHFRGYLKSCCGITC